MEGKRIITEIVPADTTFALFIGMHIFCAYQTLQRIWLKKQEDILKAKHETCEK